MIEDSTVVDSPKRDVSPEENPNKPTAGTADCNESVVSDGDADQLNDVTAKSINKEGEERPNNATNDVTEYDNGGEEHVGDVTIAEHADTIQNIDKAVDVNRHDEVTTANEKKSVLASQSDDVTDDNKPVDIPPAAIIPSDGSLDGRASKSAVDVLAKDESGVEEDGKSTAATDDDALTADDDDVVDDRGNEDVPGTSRNGGHQGFFYGRRSLTDIYES